MRIVVDLPAPFGPRKPVTLPGCDVEGQVVDGAHGAVLLGQPAHLDHASRRERDGVMTQSLSGQGVRADHPAAPTWVPRVGEGGVALAGESPGRVGRARIEPCPRRRSRAPRTRSPTGCVRWSSPPPAPAGPAALLYALATLPIGALCLALYFALFGSVVAVIYGVGLLLVPLVLATIRGFAGIERELARTLLAVDIPAGERVRRQPGRRAARRGGWWRRPAPGGRSAGWAPGC